VASIVDPLPTQHADFANRLSDVRNLYAHFGAVAEASGGASGAELYILAEVAHWVFLANVLLDLGFEEEKAKGLVQRNAYFRHLVENPAPLPLG
jgi:fucose permease